MTGRSTYDFLVADKAESPCWRVEDTIHVRGRWTSNDAILTLAQYEGISRAPCFSWTARTCCASHQHSFAAVVVRRSSSNFGANWMGRWWAAFPGKLGWFGRC
jgi:hypothetical protein